jgi:hypothetical protein
MSLTAGALLAVAPFLILGLAGVVCAIGFGWRDYRRARTWPSADAVVAKMVEQSDIDGNTFRPVVEFTDTHGDRIRVGAYWGTRPPRYEVGARVRVCYDPLDPRRAQIIGENRSFLIALGSTGLAVAVVAAVLIRHILEHGVPTAP